MASLKDFMAPDPEEGRRAGLAAVLPHSGFAAPVLAYQLGKSQRAGEEFQKAETERAKGAFGDYNMQQYADKFIEKVFKLAEKDPVAATQMLKVEVDSGQNKYLSNFKGMQFNGAEGGQVLFTDGEGQSWLVNRAKVGGIMEKGGSFEEAVKAGYATKIGKPKPPTGGSGKSHAEMLNDISLMASRLNSSIGRPDIMQAIANTTDPAQRDALFAELKRQSAERDPGISVMVEALDRAIKDYEAAYKVKWTGNLNPESLNPPPAPAPANPAALVPQPAPATRVPSPRQVVQGMAPLDALAAEKARRGLR